MKKAKKINLEKVFFDTFEEQMIEIEEETYEKEIYYNRPFYKRRPFWLWIVFDLIIVNWSAFYFGGYINITSILLALFWFAFSEILAKAMAQNIELSRLVDSVFLENTYLYHFMEITEEVLNEKNCDDECIKEHTKKFKKEL